MFGFRKIRQNNNNHKGNLGRADWFLLSVSDNGALEATVQRPTLGPDDVADLLTALDSPEFVAGVTSITLNFGNVRAITPNWTLVLAMLMNFARRTSARCCVVGLHAQSAEAAMMYRRNSELAALLATTRKAA